MYGLACGTVLTGGLGVALMVVEVDEEDCDWHRHCGVRYDRGKRIRVGRNDMME